MNRKKKPEFVVGDGGQRWNLDDFDLDSFGVEAPLRDRLESLRASGCKPDDVSDDIRERYVKYLETVNKKRK